MEKKGSAVNRRNFLRGTAAAGLGAATATAQVRFDHTADVVIVGAGASGLPAAIMARDHGASVIVIDANHDIGGHAMLSGGRIPLGGGTSLQKKYGVADSADQVYLDHTNHRNPEFRHADRDLVRAWADENVASFEFLLENGVIFDDVAPTIVNGGTVPRLFVTKVYSDNYNETINGRPGSGLVRHLEASARKKGATILLRHKLMRIIRENPFIGTGPGNHGAVRRQGSEYPREERSHTSHRRAHQQRGIPQEIRPAPDRGIPDYRRTLDQAKRRQ